MDSVTQKTSEQRGNFSHQDKSCYIDNLPRKLPTELKNITHISPVAM